jgi:hypothetical protein
LNFLKISGKTPHENRASCREGQVRADACGTTD